MFIRPAMMMMMMMMRWFKLYNIKMVYTDIFQFLYVCQIVRQMASFRGETTGLVACVLAWGWCWLFLSSNLLGVSFFCQLTSSTPCSSGFVCKLVLRTTLLYKMCFKYIIYLYFIVFSISKGIYTWWTGFCFRWSGTLLVNCLQLWASSVYLCLSFSTFDITLCLLSPFNPPTAEFYSEVKDSSFYTEGSLDITVH